MARLLPTALVLVLLAGTAAAFAVTERLKLEPALLSVGQGVRVFSPVCDCPTGSARIPITLRAGGRLRVEIADAEDETVRRVFDGRVRAGQTVVVWDGRDEEGQVQGEGIYRPRVVLGDEERTFLLPMPLRLDVTPPRVRLLSARPRLLTPDGDGRRERLIVRYRLSERAAPELRLGERAVVAPNRQRRGVHELNWWAKIDGETVPAGRYRVELVATDVAGNRSDPHVVDVRVRR